MAVAVEIQNVSKDFKISSQHFSSFKERMLHLGKIEHETFHALKDVSMSVEEGQTFALLGHNGSGKSTLLKCIAGILRPTNGLIRVRGRMAALLELGAGFHPDLTGRENIFMNATLMGISKQEVESKLDEIVAFAELEQFIDNQVKHYSSGMYVRLGFAVAVHMDPDILLVDEVLAVGDEAFQRKCIERVRQFQREGRTIIVVTHSVDMVRQICQRAAVLDHGIKVAEGPTGEAIRTYREYLLSKGVAPESVGVHDEVVEVEPEVVLTPGGEQAAKATQALTITDVSLAYAHKDERPYLLPGEGLEITATYDVPDSLDDVVFGIAVYDLEGRVVFGSNTLMLGVDVPVLSGHGEVRFSIPSVPLLDGDYLLTVAAHNKGGGTVYDWHDQQYRFEVMNPGFAEGLVYVPTNVSVTQG